ncbi:MAG: arsenite methyltransferase [archaeon]
MDDNKQKTVVNQFYSDIAKKGSTGCSCDCTSDHYEKSELVIAPDAHMGLGCGNPTALGEIKEGDVVLDLGSGPGFDAFLAAKKVGQSGKVIGVDASDEMLVRAQATAEKSGVKNVSFIKGDIESLPVDDASVDIIISNCVINLAPDKKKVFSECHRVLKPGGKLFVSDIVLNGELTPEQKADPVLIGGCVAGAIPKDDYVRIIEDAGFTVHSNDEKTSPKPNHQGLPVMSLQVVASIQ